MNVSVRSVAAALVLGAGAASPALSATEVINYQDKPLAPQRLPGDNLPPFGMLSADGADGSHVFVAQRKAIVAVEFGMPGKQVKDLAGRGDPSLLKRIKPNMFVQFGSYPITQGGKLIGPIVTLIDSPN